MILGINFINFSDLSTTASDYSSVSVCVAVCLSVDTITQNVQGRQIGTQ